MTIPTEVIMRMATIGLNEEQAKAVADMLTAVETATAAAHEQSKEKARARWRNWKAKQTGSNASKRLPTTGNVGPTLARAEDRNSNSEIEPLKKNTHTDLTEFKAALSGECDENRVEEFVKLRRKKRGTLTGHAANLFKADAKACGLSLPDAVDTCISRNWITVKPEWLERPTARGSPPQRSNPLSDAFGMMRGHDDRPTEPVSDSVRYLPAASR